MLLRCGKLLVDAGQFLLVIAARLPTEVGTPASANRSVYRARASRELFRHRSDSHFRGSDRNTATPEGARRSAERVLGPRLPTVPIGCLGRLPAGMRKGRSGTRSSEGDRKRSDIGSVFVRAYPSGATPEVNNFPRGGQLSVSYGLGGRR